jgi:MULE transposase domain
MKKTPDGKFYRLFIMPGVAEGTFTNCLPLLLLDGTFFLNAYHQTILLAIGRDGDNRPYLIAWAIVESENTESWTWFIQQIVAGCPSLNEPVKATRGSKYIQTTVMSDRDKGLLNAEKEALPMASQAFCAWHLAENIKKKFGQKARHAFWKLVYVQTLGQWVSALEKFEEAGGKVRRYILLTLIFIVTLYLF